MAQCPNCGRDSAHEFCEFCSEYVGAPVDAVPAAVPAPDPVLPGPQHPRPAIRRRAGAEERGERDLSCAACGRYSAPGRTFCEHCGAELGLVAAAPGGVSLLPWWRRMFDRVVRRHTAVVVGPIGPRHVLPEPADHRWPAVLAVLLVLLVVGVAGPPAGRAAYRALTRRYEPVRPSVASGTATVGHHSSRLVDGISNTSWIAPRRTPTGTVVRIDFPRPADVDRVGITQGAGEKPEWYAAYARAARVSLAFDDGTTAAFGLADEPGFQSVRVRARGVRWVRLTVVETYAGSVAAHGPALSEVEFFRLD